MSLAIGTVYCYADASTCVVVGYCRDGMVTLRWLSGPHRGLTDWATPETFSCKGWRLVPAVAA